MKEIYLDNAAGAPISFKSQKAMAKAMKAIGNPSSFNDSGRISKNVLKGSRQIVADFIGAKLQEIIFTGSGSEANNLAIFGTTDHKDLKEIIITPIEHMSVLSSTGVLSKKGYKILRLNVNEKGIVTKEDLERKITNKTVLVSVMYANNEIGTIQPIVSLGKVIDKWRKENNSKFPLFHVDACQALGYLNCDVNHLGVDLMSFNSSKIGGPRGVGVLYVKRGTIIKPLIYGGEQENGLRAGTENVEAIAGMAEAIKELSPKKETERLSTLRDYFIKNIIKAMPDIKVNGSIESRLPNNINISIIGVTSENLLLELDKHGIRAGSGSACTSHSVEASHVLKAIGVDKKYIQGALRISMGIQTKKKDMDELLRILPKIIRDVRKRYEVVKT